MASPIKIPIIGDVNSFLRDTDDVVGGLENVGDSLDGLAREAAQAGDKAGEGLAEGMEAGADEIIRRAKEAGDEAGRRFAQGLADGRPFDELAAEFEDAARKIVSESKDMARKVENSAEDTERSFKDAFDAAGENGATKLRKIGDDADAGFRKAGEGAENFRDEADETAREAAASFDGSAESIGDAFQEVAANAFSGFGPAGALAGLGIAAGLGSAFAAFQKSKEEAQALQDDVGELAGTFVDTGSQATQSLAGVAESLRGLAEETEEGKRSLAEYREMTELLGLSWGTVSQAVGGNMEAVNEVMAQLIEREEELKVLQDDRSLGVQTAAGVELALNDQLQGKLDEVKTRWEQARAEEMAYYEAGVAAFPAHAELIADAAEDVVGLSDAWSTAFAAITEDGKITNEELTASLDQMLAEQDRKIIAYTWAQRNLTVEQMTALEQFGEDRAQVIETLMNTPPELRQSTLNKLQTVGERMGQAETQGFINGMPKEIGGPSVDFRADTSDIDRAIGRLRKTTVWVPTVMKPLSRQVA